MTTPQEPQTDETSAALSPAETGTPTPAPAPADAPRRPGLDSKGRVRRTRAATAWASAIGLALVTVPFVIFVVQNSQSIRIKFLWLNGHVAAAAALLIAAVAGALLVGIPAAVRIGQLRRSLKRNASRPA